jgi:hypothetical protein
MRPPPYQLIICHINKMGLWNFGQPLHPHHPPAQGPNKVRTPVDDQVVHINVYQQGIEIPAMYGVNS